MTRRTRFSAGLIALAITFSAPAQADTITQAMAAAYENSPTLASAFMSVRSAREAVRSAQGGHLPNIGASASLSGSWTDTVNVPGAGAVHGSFWGSSGSVGLSYSQTLFDNFATDAAIAGAQARYEAAIHGATNTEQNVLLQAATAYYNVLAYQRTVEIRRENLGFVEAQLHSAQSRLEIGEGTRLDVAQAEAALASADAALQGAIANLSTARASYQRHIGRAPENLSATISTAGLMPSSLEQAMSVAETSHPGLQASAASIRAAQYQAEQTRASFGPKLSLNGQAGIGGMTSDTWTPSAQVGLSLTIPIFTPTQDPSVQQANIGLIQSELDAFATRDSVNEAVRQAWAGIQSATAQIESATAAVAASRLALQAVTDQNEVGQSTTLDVLNARASLLTVEEGLTAAQAQRAIATYSLLAAIGRLTAEDLGLPVRERLADGSPVQTQQMQDPWGSMR